MTGRQVAVAAMACIAIVLFLLGASCGGGQQAQSPTAALTETGGGPAERPSATLTAEQEQERVASGPSDASPTTTTEDSDLRIYFQRFVSGCDEGGGCP